ncbi:MAG: hypothetical protein ACXV8U_21230 [Methylobacter sp.]
MLDCIVNTWLEKVFLDASFEPNGASKYGAPSINDQNVGAIISGLIATNTEVGRQMAEKLAAIQKSDASVVTENFSAEERALLRAQEMQLEQLESLLG